MRRWSQIILRSLVVSGIFSAFFFCLMVPAELAAMENPSSPPDRDAVAGLPLIELPAWQAKNDILAIILSGDGGWADLDKVFGTAFQKRGISTVGFDCLKYFWKKRQPAEVSRDIEKVVRYYLQAWEKKRVLLVGFSFGACWLPFLVNRLPVDISPYIHLCVLLGPSSFVNVEVHMLDWMSDNRRQGALDVLPEAVQIKHPVLCVYGTEEKDSICPLLKGEHVKNLPMPGTHHFNYAYTPIINAIFQTLEAVETETLRSAEGKEPPPQKGLQ